MGKKVKVELNKEGVRALLRSPEMESICREYAENAVAKLGNGYEVGSYTGKNRVNASITAVTPEAIRKNLKSNTVLKAVLGK